MSRLTVAGAIQTYLSNGSDSVPNRLAGGGQIPAEMALGTTNPIHRLTARGKLRGLAYDNTPSIIQSIGAIQRV